MSLSPLTRLVTNTPAHLPIPVAPVKAGVDTLLLRKLSYGTELFAVGELAAARAMLTHVIDVADAKASEDQALHTIALRLMAHIEIEHKGDEQSQDWREVYQQ